MSLTLSLGAGIYIPHVHTCYGESDRSFYTVGSNPKK